jgi:hypothetical protein
MSVFGLDSVTLIWTTIIYNVNAGFSWCGDDYEKSVKWRDAEVVATFRVLTFRLEEVKKNPKYISVS